VVIRTYVNLQLYRLESGELIPVGAPVALDALDEPQGEAVDIREDGTVLLAGEERGGEAGPISRLICVLGAR
jgi:predicted RecA/RadA family phage recombinase